MKGWGKAEKEVRQAWGKDETEQICEKLSLRLCRIKIGLVLGQNKSWIKTGATVHGGGLRHSEKRLRLLRDNLRMNEGRIRHSLGKNLGECKVEVSQGVRAES